MCMFIVLLHNGPRIFINTPSIMDVHTLYNVLYVLHSINTNQKYLCTMCTQRMDTFIFSSLCVWWIQVNWYCSYSSCKASYRICTKILRFEFIVINKMLHRDEAWKWFWFCFHCWLIYTVLMIKRTLV